MRDLPDAGIVVIHRSDGSGTTYAWSDYLSKTSAEWKASVGAGLTLSWPVGTGVEYNEGVAATVQRTPELDWICRTGLCHPAPVEFRSRAKCLRRVSFEPILRVSPLPPILPMTGNSAAASITNASGKGVYPITTFTFLLWPPQVDDSRKKADLLKLLQWVLTSGQRECSALGYAPLPHDLANRQLQALDSFK